LQSLTYDANRLVRAIGLFDRAVRRYTKNHTSETFKESLQEIQWEGSEKSHYRFFETNSRVVYQQGTRLLMLANPKFRMIRPINPKSIIEINRNTKHSNCDSMLVDHT